MRDTERAARQLDREHPLRRCKVGHEYEAGRLHYCPTCRKSPEGREAQNAAARANDARKRSAKPCPGCGLGGMLPPGKKLCPSCVESRKRDRKREERRSPAARRRAARRAERQRTIRAALQGPRFKECQRGHRYVPKPHSVLRAPCSPCERERKRGAKKSPVARRRIKARQLARIYAEGGDRLERYLARRREKSVRWRAKNLDTSRSYSRARRARERAAPGEPFTARQWRAVVRFYGGGCAYCGADWEHVDHVVPLALGGAHALANLVPACARCNLSKHATVWAPLVPHPWS